MGNIINDNNNLYTLTDLHSHLLGVLPAENMLQIGLKHNLQVPVEHIVSMGLDCGLVDVNNECVSLKQILDVFKDGYWVNLTYNDNQKDGDTHISLVKNYYYRSVYFKDSAMLKDILHEIAVFYKSMGVKYVELTTKWFYKEYFLNVVSEALPTIESETGVKIRFLASIDRTYNEERLNEFINYAIDLINNPYIVGVDFLGNEIESVDKLKGVIELITEAVLTKNNHYCIRVHSGEKDNFINNTLDVLNIIKNKKESMEIQNNTKYNYPYIRIGHALYGFNEQCINLCKELNVIIEINSTSNIKLNNVTNANNIPLRRYLDKKLKVVLGTDSPGLFNTTTIKELEIAKSIGLTHGELIDIIELEEQIINR